MSNNIEDLLNQLPDKVSVEQHYYDEQQKLISNDSPYCPVCDACGEDGCCSAINCKQDPNGHYCETYLKDLKFGYKMDKWIADNLYHKMPKELQAEYDLAWDKIWDEVYETNLDS